MRQRCWVAAVLFALLSLLLTPLPASASTPTWPSYEYAPFLSVGGDSYGSSAAIADVSGDARLDVLYTTSFNWSPSTDNRLFVFRQKNDGTIMATPDVYVPHGDYPSLVIGTGDLDGDGDTDVAVSTNTGVDVFRQSGGVLTGPTLYSAPGYVTDVHVVDMNGDGRKDLLYLAEADGGQSQYLIRTQSSSGTLSSATSVATAYGYDVLVGDLNGDARPDLVATDDDPAGVRIFFQGAGLTFTEGMYPGSSRLHTGAIGDVTGDGRNDLVVGSALHDLVIVPGMPDGSLGSPTPIELSQNSSAGGVEIVDLNGDGYNDIAASTDEGMAILLGSSVGLLENPCTYSGGGGVSVVDFGDVTGDGLIDTALADRGGAYVERRLEPGSLMPTSFSSFEVISQIDLGEEAYVSGRLSVPGGGCLGTGQVDVYRTDPGGAPQKVGEATLTSYRAWYEYAFTFQDVPPIPGDVSYFARFNGDQIHDGSESPSGTVTVNRALSNVTLSVSKTKILFGRTVELTATLTGGESNRDVGFYSTGGGTDTLLGTVTASDAGTAQLVVSPRHKTTYVAKYAGDAFYYPNVSSPKVVNVVPIVEGKMIKYASKSGSYAVYRPTQNVYYWTQVTPNHAGTKVTIFLEVKVGGRWKTSGSDSFKLGSKSIVIIYIPGSAFPKGYLWRFRTKFPGDGDHLQAFSKYSYFKFSS